MEGFQGRTVKKRQNPNGLKGEKLTDRDKINDYCKKRKTKN